MLSWVRELHDLQLQGVLKKLADANNNLLPHHTIEVVGFFVLPHGGFRPGTSCPEEAAAIVASSIRPSSTCKEISVICASSPSLGGFLTGMNPNKVMAKTHDSFTGEGFDSFGMSTSLSIGALHSTLLQILFLQRRARKDGIRILA
ncbi:hypothetical protein GOP47_0029439 [Adiantum capillus-veneris]|nr:hypothetical protein GOP47_0029439 [Adiantum capillus-veneris]